MGFVKADRHQNHLALRLAPLMADLLMTCGRIMSEADHLCRCLLCRQGQAVHRLSGCTQQLQSSTRLGLPSTATSDGFKTEQTVRLDH